MKTIPCPGCRTDLEPSATVCPICLRPRGKIEITRAYAALREMERQRRKRPFVIAGYALAAGAASWLIYRYHGPIAETVVAAKARAGRFVEESMASADPAENRAPAHPLEAAPEAAIPPLSSGSPSTPARIETAPTRTLEANASRRSSRVEDLPLPAFDPSSQWVLYGRVYDLITLLPVSDVQLAFTANGSGMGGGCRSDANGRFAAVLQRLTQGSYELRASRLGYASAALYESDIPYAALPPSERRDMARSAQAGDVSLPPLTDISGEGSIRRDVFLAPSR